MRIKSNISCYYMYNTFNSGELETIDGPSGVYGYSGKTVWFDQECQATEFEACIGHATFCSSGHLTTVNCGIDDDPDDVEECAADNGNMIIDVRVKKRLSNKECYYYSGNHTAYTEYTGVYGFTSAIMWAYRGCRAEFEICTALATVQSITSGYIPSTLIEVTVHSVITNHMSSTPTAERHFSTTQSTLHRIPTGLMPSTLTGVRFFTSQAITGTTIQVAMHTRLAIATVAGAVTGVFAGFAAIAGVVLYMMKYRASCQRVYPVFSGASRDPSRNKKQEEPSNTSED